MSADLNSMLTSIVTLQQIRAKLRPEPNIIPALDTAIECILVAGGVPARKALRNHLLVAASRLIPGRISVRVRRIQALLADPRAAAPGEEEAASILAKVSEIWPNRVDDRQLRRLIDVSTQHVCAKCNSETGGSTRR